MLRANRSALLQARIDPKRPRVSIGAVWLLPAMLVTGNLRRNVFPLPSIELKISDPWVSLDDLLREGQPDAESATDPECADIPRASYSWPANHHESWSCNPPSRTRKPPFESVRLTPDTIARDGDGDTTYQICHLSLQNAAVLLEFPNASTSLSAVLSGPE
jgi:hypothetical protein